MATEFSTELSAALSFALLLAASWWVGRGVVGFIPGKIPAPRTFMALPCGLISFLVFFSVIASLLPSYEIALPVTFIGIYVFTKVFGTSSEQIDVRSQNVVCFLLFFLVGCLFLYLHSLWPAIHWENSGDRAGVEKLFNLSLQQSFLFGNGFPPEWIWLSGEKVQYYLLPKMLPGLASWLSRVAFNEPQAGGIHFMLSEATYGALSSSCVTAWIMLLLAVVAPSSSVAKRTALAVLVGILVIVETHAYGLFQGLSRLISGLPLDWWSLQDEIVRYTQNQYPIWLLLLGDNHAYSQIIPFQICLWGAVLLVALQEKTDLRLAIFTGVCAAAVFLSHIPSVLLDLATIVPAAVVIISWEALNRNFSRVRTVGANVLAIAATAVVLVARNAAITGDTKKVLVSTDVVSRLPEFLSVQFWPLFWIAALIVPSIAGRSFNVRSLRETLSVHPVITKLNVWEWSFLFTSWAVLIGFYLERPAIGLALFLACLIFILVSASDSAMPVEAKRSLAIIAALTFGIWILPELLAIDNRADNRTLWIRFNIVLRFWPEGYFLIPFTLTIALGNALLASIRKKQPTVIFFGLCSLMFALFMCSHIPAIQDRARRSGYPHSLNGFNFTESDVPNDFEIINYLTRLPPVPRVVIAEACGTNRYSAVPLNYSWPGRVSAFSGRLAICGWARHAFLHQPVSHSPNGETIPTWTRLMRYDEAWLRILSEAGATFPNWSAEQHTSFVESSMPLLDALQTLRDFGVTHFVYGDFETLSYGKVDLDRLAEALGGVVVFQARTRGMGVIATGS